MAASFVPAGLEAARSIDGDLGEKGRNISLNAGGEVVWHSRFDTLALVKLAGGADLGHIAGQAKAAPSDDELWAAYLPLSGSTHMLNFFTHAVLRLLSELPMALPALHHALEQANLQAGRIPLSVVIRTIEDLDSAGLIYPNWAELPRQSGAGRAD